MKKHDRVGSVRRRLIATGLLAMAVLGLGSVKGAEGATMTSSSDATVSQPDTVSRSENLRLAKQLLEKMGSGASAEEISSLCVTDLDWNIPGDSGVLPWVGQKKGRQAMADFIRDSRSMVERVSFNVTDILASEHRAIILGHLQSRIKSTGKLIDGDFAVVLTFSGTKIAKFVMLEDSFAVSAASRH